MSTEKNELPGSASGSVKYELIDPFKLRGQELALTTVVSLEGTGFKDLDWTRGESAHGLLLPDGKTVMLSVVETLGTKDQVAEIMYRLTGTLYFDAIAQDTIAMMVNDLGTLGGEPKIIHMHAGAGLSEWFGNMDRGENLLSGWARACIRVGAVWGGGESPALANAIMDGATVLCGPAIGFTPLVDLWNPVNIQDGDAIVILESSGIHANGLTDARKVALRPEDYLIRLSDGRTYGESLLDPTILYTSVIKNIRTRMRHLPTPPVRYAVNITGHGWAKLMRAPKPFEYFIHQLAPVPPVFGFIQNERHFSYRTMYKKFNMGAGYAFFTDPDFVPEVMAAAQEEGLLAFPAGTIRAADQKRVVLEPLDVMYDESDLAVR